MKINNIYVGGSLSLNSGAKALAAYPAQKGDKCSWVLLDSGHVAKIDGTRIERMAPANYLKANGWVLAQADDQNAMRLADELEIRAGKALVENASQCEAQRLWALHESQEVVLVPFEAEKPIVTAMVEARRGYITLYGDLSAGYTSAQIGLVFDPTRKDFAMGYALGNGWLVTDMAQAELMPRVSEYGGPLERAAFIVCTSGLAKLVGDKNLVMADDAVETDPFCRGKLTMALSNGDQLIVGADAGDEVLVHYVRDDQVIYQRTGLANGSQLRIGDFIGAIAAAIVHVQDMDAAAAKKQPKKKAA